jgi:uncharacterized membrane protein
MARIEKTIEVKAPVEKVWAVCSDVVGYTRFMETAKRIEKTGDRTYHWEMEMAGRTVEFDGQITEVVENERFAWKSTGAMSSKGSWSLEPTDEGTRITLVMDYEMPGIVGAIMDKVKVSKGMEKQMESQLQAMKALLE